MSLARRLARLEAPHHERAARLWAAHALERETPALLDSFHALLDKPTAEAAADVLTRHLDAARFRLMGGETLDETELETLPVTPDVVINGDALAMRAFDEAFGAVQKRISTPAYERWLRAAAGEEENG